MSSNTNSRGSSRRNATAAAKSLLVIILEASPTTWGEREIKRKATDKARLAAGKRSVGPATLDEAILAVHAFGGAYDGLQRDSVLIVIGVAGNETAIVFPRKTELQRKVFEEGGKVEIRNLYDNLVTGMAELVTRAASKAQQEAPNADASDGSAAMAAALSLALCTINRFLVSSGGGVSALAADTSALWNRHDDEGVLSLLGGGEDHDGNKNNLKTAWSPRVLMIQVSPDRTRDYNAFMNCAFASTKHNVVLDGCFIPSGIKGDAKSSPFLEQACDLTGGVFLAPSGASQVGGALTEVLISVFLAPRSARPGLNLPAHNKVDFRARCFDTGESVDMAYVCNQCLSTFKSRPNGVCPTCGAEIKATEARRRASNTPA